MIRRIKADIRTLEWTDAAEVAALCAFIACVIVWAGILSGKLPT